jgi:acetylcholinesterase
MPIWGLVYALTPQIKRISSILGDLVFQAPRRVYLSLATSNKVPVWTYRFNHVWVAQLGSFHASELPSVVRTSRVVLYPSLLEADATYFVLIKFGTLSDTTSKQMQSLWISFANNLDPNKHSQPSLNIPYWPQYTTGNKSQILFDVQDTTMSR